MTASLQAMLQVGAKPALFPPNSRYHTIDTSKLETVDGETKAYLRRRFVPPPEKFVLVQEYKVNQGDRLDNIAAKYLGDPELFWLVCDANAALRPNELTDTIGHLLRITLPEGLAGSKIA